MSIFDEHRELCTNCSGRIETWRDHECKKPDSKQFMDKMIDDWRQVLQKFYEHQQCPTQESTSNPSYLLDPEHTLFDI